jgi:hypothetical protein
MAGVQQVETAAYTHHSLPGAFPPTPAGKQIGLRNDLSQTSACRAARQEPPGPVILARPWPRQPSPGVNPRASARHAPAIFDAIISGSLASASLRLTESLSPQDRSGI